MTVPAPPTLLGAPVLAPLMVGHLWACSGRRSRPPIWCPRHAAGGVLLILSGGLACGAQWWAGSLALPGAGGGFEATLGVPPHWNGTQLTSGGSHLIGGHADGHLHFLSEGTLRWWDSRGGRLWAARPEDWAWAASSWELSGWGTTQMMTESPGIRLPQNSGQHAF